MVSTGIRKNRTWTVQKYLHYIQMALPDYVLNYHIEKMLKFEMTLARYYTADDLERRNFSRLYTPFTSINNIYLFVDFNSFFEGLSTKNHELRRYFYSFNNDFIVMKKNLLRKLSYDFYRTFDSNVVINYLFFRLIASRSSYFPQHNYGSVQDICARQLMNLFKHAGSRLYLNNAIPDAYKRRKIGRLKHALHS